MMWLKFALFAVIIVIAAYYLAKTGDIIAIRTKMGGMFIGVLLLAGATSLPELLTSFSAIQQNTPGIAAGNMFGSNLFNMLLLAIIDLSHRSQRILRKAAMRHALTGSATILMIILVLVLFQADIDIKIGWIGLDSLIIIAAYILLVRLIASQGKHASAEDVEIPEETPRLWIGIVGFLVAAAVLIVVTPLMVQTSNEIAEVTGLGTSFVGSVLVAMVTSLPELVTTISAIRLGSSDMAIGNLFGSNMFNMFALGLTDTFYTDGRFISAIDPVFMLVGLMGLLMTAIALLGNVARLEKRLWFFEIDSLLLIFVYLVSTWLLFQQGIG